ncbi:MAG: hypothetical protein V3R99_08630 [Thermoguttaceae bacterium]
MKRCIRLAVCCLLIALMASATSAFADPKPPKKPKTPAKEAPAKEEPADKSKASDEQAKPESKESEAKEPEAKESEAKSSDAEAKPAQPPAEPKPTTHKVTKGELKIETTLDGVFEAKKTAEIFLKLEAWTTLTVVSAVEHGAEVKRGDVLVTLDLEKIDRAIGDLRDTHKVSDLAMQLAEQQLKTLKKTTPMDMAANERMLKETNEDYDYYVKVSRPMSLKSAEFMLKSAQQNYENQLEEVRQLEKMYNADDLTEETEEIILKRARAALERAEFYLEDAKLYHKRTLKTSIPRRDISNKNILQRNTLVGADAKVELPVALIQQNLSLDALKLARKRSDEKLAKLEADRAAMVVKAPLGGIVYYGQCTGGKVSSSSTTAAALKPGGTLAAKKVFMTIIQPRPMHIRATVAESKLQHVRAGIKGTAKPAGYPDIEMTAIVDSVTAIPVSAGSFGSKITVATDRQSEAVMPGMTCKVTLVVYENKEALTVPPKALKTDDSDAKKQYVNVLDKDGKSKRRDVTVGRKTATKVEILKGLAEGDEVLLDAPKEASKETEEAKKETEEAPKEAEEAEKETDEAEKDSK